MVSKREDSSKYQEILGEEGQCKTIFPGIATFRLSVSERNCFHFCDDKEKIEELWTPLAKAWFTEGINDPRISVIKVVPDNGFYWDNKHGKFYCRRKNDVWGFDGTNDR